ncbi:MAG TPA: flagellar basal body P-ring formation chaperone FlgA [Steroidobacteraceae bacterium]|nr:flagellar basal body P-ring formation chaperone FlgA [Steroidobacteraceae bacterium]
MAIKFHGAWALLAFVLAMPAFANVQDLASVQAAAEEFVRAEFSDSTKHYVTAARLDSRLHVQACEKPLHAFAPNPMSTTGKTTVGVRCEGASEWTLYVPVSVEVEVPVLVLRRALPRRSPVQANDVEPQIRRLPGSAANFITDVASLRGHRLKRALPAGAPLTIDALAPDVLVRRGQQVTLLASVGAVEIRAQGQALNDAGAYDRVRVQNVTSLKVVEGVVESASTVRVGDARAIGSPSVN